LRAVAAVAVVAACVVVAFRVAAASHGATAWSELWYDATTALAVAGFHAVAIDIPPSGYSDRPGTYAARLGGGDPFTSHTCFQAHVKQMTIRRIADVWPGRSEERR
jgi:hypothetical protein